MGRDIQNQLQPSQPVKIATINKQLIISALVELANAEMHERDIAARGRDNHGVAFHQKSADRLLERVRDLRDARQVIVICE